MAFFRALSFLCSSVLIIGATVSANKYQRRAEKTRGVFPVLEANEEYDLNKKEFTKRQSTCGRTVKYH